MTTAETTLDRFLGGRLAIEQPGRGRHRAGLDAILLAALVPPDAAGHLVDLGAGVGTAGLAAAIRAPGLRVTLVERDPAAVALARANAARPENGLLGRVMVAEADVTAREAAREAAGLARESADWVILNPPFFAPGAVNASPAAARAAAHVLPEGGLAAWLRTAAALARPGGRLAVVFRADGLAEILAGLAGRFGAAAVRPVHPRAGEAAHRILVTATKGSRAAPGILPGLVLHPPGSSRYLDEADAVLRGEAGLDQ
ncbi:tRNA1(Val) (adenine(37)-N6)-methyltransferase [Prosthecomicrobium sp. N25]|uniref:tRNA1(Val) (adenine(37)-N6)-methyltransferase n=1 Tax=Prosthecomicrobium sp. N25 TaxID=3129254 RepID=UPI003076F471